MKGMKDGYGCVWVLMCGIGGVNVLCLIELMSQKKISGYVIFLKEILGKGSYGSVLMVGSRCTAESRTEPSCHVP
jgi:hypothetical protein